jgi:pimeloyl-ACP methyl ester carboxylesterase
MAPKMQARNAPASLRLL